MEKDIQLKTFDFFKKEHKQIEVAAPLPPRDYSLILLKTMSGGAVGIMLFLMGAIVHDIYKRDIVREKVIHVFTSGNIEKDLNQLNTPVKISKSKDKINYSFKVNLPKMFGLMSPRVQYYEIEKTPSSHTLTLKDQKVEGIDSKLYNYKELLKDVELSEIKTLPNIKTGGMDISFKIED